MHRRRWLTAILVGLCLACFSWVVSSERTKPVAEALSEAEAAAEPATLVTRAPTPPVTTAVSLPSLEPHVDEPVAVEQSEIKNSCGRMPSIDRIVIEWADLERPTRAASRAAADGVLRANVHNRSTESALITVRFQGEGDGVLAERYVGQIDVEPGKSGEVSIDLNDLFDAPLSALQFSASGRFFAEALQPSGRSISAESSSLFFHAEGGDLLTYDDDARVALFGGGDFRGGLGEGLTTVTLPDGTEMQVTRARVSVSKGEINAALPTIRKRSDI